MDIFLDFALSYQKKAQETFLGMSIESVEPK